MESIKWVLWIGSSRAPQSVRRPVIRSLSPLCIQSKAAAHSESLISNSATNIALAAVRLLPSEYLRNITASHILF